MKWLDILTTALRLGVVNLFRVLYYRVSIRVGINPVRKLSSAFVRGDYFCPYSGDIRTLPINNQWTNRFTYFGYIERVMRTSRESPNWHESCLTGECVTEPDRPWFLIPDFDEKLGDIKGVWEASRFDWVIAFAQRAVTGDKEAVAQLNRWLNDWADNNAPYLGVNWKCGQEASIRVMHLATAALILNQMHTMSPVLGIFIKAHLERISPTIMYAVAQDNNHGTSEAAALFVGGSWLMSCGDKDGARWMKQGRKWLENRSSQLILSDGSFSQYSTTYHRVMLDSYSLAEIWRESFNLPQFSADLYNRLKAATRWLFVFTQQKNGDAPNLGANDGARIIPLTDSDYRDFRPSVQLAANVFYKKSAYENDGGYDLPLLWLSIPKKNETIPAVESVDFAEGGYACIKSPKAFMLFRYPNFKFRPSQCDALHVDLWVSGVNVLRDGGTYSYNAGDRYIDYYGGVSSHNTVQFDGHDQMPRLSRFLLGRWVRTVDKKPLENGYDSQKVSAGYIDRHGCRHHRSISMLDNMLIVKDELKGFRSCAVLRWRLSEGDWLLRDNKLTNGNIEIEFVCSVDVSRIEIVDGYESRYYYHENKLSVLELEINQTGTVKTMVRF